MKKIIIVIVSLCILCVVSCNKKTEQTGNTQSNQTETSTPVKSKFGTPMHFSTVDLKGNSIDQSIFSKADVTMVNIWATWCSPCRGELPEIGKIARTYGEKGYQVLGILFDVASDSGGSPVAVKLLEDAKCDYPVLLNDSSMRDIFADVDAFPTTLFVDSKGNLIGNEYVGSMTEETFDDCFTRAIATEKALKK